MLLRAIVLRFSLCLISFLIGNSLYCKFAVVRKKQENCSCLFESRTQFMANSKKLIAGEQTLTIRIKKLMALAL